MGIIQNDLFPPSIAGGNFVPFQALGPLKILANP